MQNFSGVWTALVTPMTPDGVDYDGLGRLVESQIEGGVRGLVAVGTTGILVLAFGGFFQILLP